MQGSAHCPRWVCVLSRKATDMLWAWKVTAREKGPGLSGFAMLGT